MRPEEMPGRRVCFLAMHLSSFVVLAGLVSMVASSSVAHPRSADEIVAEVRRATEPYLDIARARADGFVQVSGMEARHGYHFMNINAPALMVASMAASGLDLARPPMLLYVEREGVWQLAGVEYALPAPPTPNPLPGAEWHRHEASCHYRDYRETPAPRASDCPPRHPESQEPFVLWHPAFAVAHVWAWIPNPDGPFAEENRALAAYGGTARPAGHAHPRSETEFAYSQVTHRVAGGVLLVLAGLIAWESWRPRRLPWSGLSSALWILFGLYLIPTSDPESWPWGPGRFVDIFADSLVLQHKLLALIPITYGVIGALRTAGLLAPGWYAVVPTLAVLAGASLFVHFHDGRFHVDAIYVQHAAMGATALAAGVMLFAARRTRGGEKLIAWGWPGLLGLLGLILLFYVEH